MLRSSAVIRSYQRLNFTSSKHFAGKKYFSTPNGPSSFPKDAAAKATPSSSSSGGAMLVARMVTLAGAMGGTIYFVRTDPGARASFPAPIVSVIDSICDIFLATSPPSPSPSTSQPAAKTTSYEFDTSAPVINDEEETLSARNSRNTHTHRRTNARTCPCTCTCPCI